MKLTHVGIAGAVAALVLSGVSDFERTAGRVATPVTEAAGEAGRSGPAKTTPGKQDQLDERDAKDRKETPRHKPKHPRRHHGGGFDIDDTPDAADEGETALACN